MHDLEPRRGVAQQPVRPGAVASGQDESVAAAREGFDEVPEYVAQAGKALKGPEFQDLVEQEGAGLAARCTGGIEEGQQGVEGFACRGRRAIGTMPRKGRGRNHGLEEAFRCRGAALDIDVLGAAAHGAVLAQALQQPGAAAAASSEDDRDP
jgi:hypothetical protein